jgi:S-formylglutathione hydrolase FrmB
MRLCAVTLLLTAAPVFAEVREATFHATSVGHEVRYVVDLPASYDEGGDAYPVIYALHGLFEGESFWQRRGLATILGELRRRGDVPELIVVAVNGGNSFFVNAPDASYEDLVTRDLLTHVERRYRVRGGRGGRGLLGVSMGGYAALRIALAQPGLFRAVAAHSAMLLTELPSSEAGAGRWHMAAFHRVFGNPIDPELWNDADPFAWAEKVDPGAVPALYFDCGSEDRFGLAQGNEELHRRLEARNISHRFFLRPGDHGYDYVRSVLERSLRFLGHHLTEGS